MKFSILLNQPSSLLFLGAIGAFLGPVIILDGYPFLNDYVSQDLIAQPEFLTFLLLVSIYTSTLAILFYPLWSSLQFLRIYIKSYSLDLILLELICILLSTLFFFSAPNLLNNLFPDIFHVPVNLGFPRLSSKIHMLVSLGSITFLPAAIGTILIPKIARIELASRLTLNDYNFSIKQYLYYRELTQLYLYSSGAIVGLITLFDGALRNLLLAVGVDQEEFPLFIVITFGLYWSAVLALYYAIGYLSLLDCGRKLQDRICSLKSSGSLIENFEDHKKIGELLQLDIRVDQALRNSIAILAPLLSGIVSHLLPTA